jgi:Dopey, N-terminal
MTDFATMLGHDVGLMIRAFAAALEDDNLLVRRCALDLILQVLRLDGIPMQKSSHEDRMIIMRAATSVVMRRDLSLNRRLYTWLLGPDENAEHQITYLRSHSLELLKTTLRVGPLPEVSGNCSFVSKDRDVFPIHGVS